MKSFYIILIIFNVIILILSLFSPLAIMMLPHQKTLPINSMVFGDIFGNPSSISNDNNNKTDPYLKVINDRLENPRILPLGPFNGPETISFNSKGQLYYTVKSGEIRYINPPFKTITKEEFKALNDSHSVHLDQSKLALVVGRALGIKFDKYDNLVIADSVKGLLYYNSKNDQLTILAASFEGKKLTFVNDLTIDDDKEIVYFTDSTSLAPILDNKNEWNTIVPSIYTCVTQTAEGRLFSYNMKTKELKLLASGIKYANGVTLDPKKESIFFVETCSARIHRYWLSGIKQGKSEIFIDNLPGIADGIDTEKNEIFISIFSARSKLVDTLNHYPILKNILFHIPFLKIPLQPSSIIKADSNTGEITGYFYDKEGFFKTISSTIVHENKLYVANLLSNFIGILDQ